MMDVPQRIRSRGIFQGDSFSPGYTAGYVWVWLQDHKQKCSYQQPVLYGKSKIVLQEQARRSWRTENSETIRWWYRYGIWPWEMCQSQFLRKVLTSTRNIVIGEDTEIQELDREGVHKYQGVDESDGIQHSKMKEKKRNEYNRRVRLILRT